MLTELVFDSLDAADLAALLDREEKKAPGHPVSRTLSSSSSSSSSSSAAPVAATATASEAVPRVTVTTPSLYLTPDLDRAFGSWRDRCRLTCGQVWRAALAERLRHVEAHRVATRKSTDAKGERENETQPSGRTRSLCERLCAIDAQPFRALVATAADAPPTDKRAILGLDFEFRALDATRSVLGVPGIFAVRMYRHDEGRDPPTLRLTVSAEINHRLLETRANVWDAKRQQWSGDLEAKRAGAPTGAAAYRDVLKREFHAPQTADAVRAAKRARSAWRTFMDQDVVGVGAEAAAADGNRSQWIVRHGKNPSEISTVFSGREDDPRTLTAFARIIAVVRWTVAQSVLMRAWQVTWESTDAYRARLHALRLALAGTTLPITLEYALESESSVTGSRRVAERLATLRRVATDQGVDAFTVTKQVFLTDFHEYDDDDDDDDDEEEDEDEGGDDD